MIVDTTLKNALSSVVYQGNYQRTSTTVDLEVVRELGVKSAPHLRDLAAAIIALSREKKRCVARRPNVVILNLVMLHKPCAPSQLLNPT